jgi:hypothetical protein
MKKLALLVLVAACAPTVSASEKIVIAANGSRVTVTADDLVVEEPTIPGMLRPATARTIPGAFGRARAVVVAKGPAARAAARPGPEVCADYGEDIVAITPPLPDFDFLAADCPDPAVLALAEAVRAALDP